MADQPEQTVSPQAPSPTLPPDPEWKPPWERSRSQTFLSRHLGTIVVGLLFVALLFWLGWTPFRTADATGALDLAVAAMEQADAMHLRASGPSRRSGRMEAWAASDGFWRIEGWSEGKLGTLSLRSGDWEVVYDARERSELITRLPASSETEGLMACGGPITAKLAAFIGAMQGMGVREWRVRSLLRGAWHVIEAEGQATADMSGLGLPYVEGERVRLRAEADPDTNLLRRFVLQRVRGGGWATLTTADFTWNQKAPAAAYEFKPPRGTKVVADAWGGQHADVVEAEGETEGWRVTLHAINVNGRGDLSLILSRQALDRGRMELDEAVDLEVQVSDGAEGEYAQVSCHRSVPALWGGYFRVVLQRESEGPPANWVDLVIRPYPRGEGADQSVRFAHISLPPPVEEQ